MSVSWSDAEKKYQERLAAQAREREAEQVRRAMEHAQAVREAQAKQRKIQAFLAAMHQAGNPGLRYYTLWNWLRLKGYWPRYPNSHERPPEGEWVRIDGTFRCLMQDPYWTLGRIDGDVKALSAMLVEILHRHGVPIPADAQTPSSR